MPSHTLVNRAGHSLTRICPFNMVPNEAGGVGRTFPRALPLNCFKENPGSKQKLAVSIQPFISLNKQAATRLSPPWESSPRQQADLGKREKSALPPFSGSTGHMCTMQIQPHANQTLSSLAQGQSSPGCCRASKGRGAGLSPLAACSCGCHVGTEHMIRTFLVLQVLL